MIKVIVGLGNPGPEYVGTRHNVGFLIAEAVARRWEISLREKKFGGGVKVVWGKGDSPKGEVVVCLPQTYMNESGRAVSQLLDYYRFEPEALCVIHDDMDLDWGRLRFDFNAGAAGQKGVQSIIDGLGTKRFARLRVGIGRPSGMKEEAVDYVLGRFSAEQEASLPTVKSEAVSAIELYLTQGFEKAQQKFH